MRHLILVVHISLDGFVAGPKGELDGFPAGDENLAFVNNLTQNSDAALFGRTSYELLNSFWPTAGSRPGATKAEIAYSDWYNNVQKIVISKRMPNVSVNNTIVVREKIANEISYIKKQPGKNILIFGSPSTSYELMQHDLIDSYWMFVNPIIFGEGIPLFTRLAKKTRLQLLSTRQFSNGEIALNYVADK